MAFWKNKYLVKRRDGTVPEWPWFVHSAKDPAAPAALMAYAAKGEELGYDEEYIQGVRSLAEEFERYWRTMGAGDPDAPKHREDDPAVVSELPDDT